MFLNKKGAFWLHRGFWFFDCINSLCKIVKYTTGMTYIIMLYSVYNEFVNLSIAFFTI